eukprot:gene2068-18841_t
MFGQRSIALAVCCTVGLAIFAASLTHAVAADQPPTIQPAVEAEPAEAFVMPVAEDVPVDEAVVVSLEVPVDDTFPQTFTDIMLTGLRDRRGRASCGTCGGMLSIPKPNAPANCVQQGPSNKKENTFTENACVSGKYTDGTGGVDNRKICKAQSTCGPGEKISADTLTAARTCSDCDGAVEYQNETKHQLEKCEPHGDCKEDEYFVPNATSPDACIQCPADERSKCTTCTAPDACTALDCADNWFNEDGNFTNGCEVTCPAVASANCTACSDANTCTAVTCEAAFFNFDDNFNNGAPTAAIGKDLKGTGDWTVSGDWTSSADSSLGPGTNSTADSGSVSTTTIAIIVSATILITAAAAAAVVKTTIQKGAKIKDESHTAYVNPLYQGQDVGLSGFGFADELPSDYIEIDSAVDNDVTDSAE